MILFFVLCYREIELAEGGLVMGEALKWYDEKADNPPWIDALAELRRQVTREGPLRPTRSGHHDRDQSVR